MNVLSNSDAFAGLSNGHFLSKTPGACKTWDINADGYCRADAVASIVLKRLEDAVSDNDNILGELVFFPLRLIIKKAYIVTDSAFS